MSSKLILKVPDMTCGHCVQTVTKAATTVPGVLAARVDLASKTLTVEGAVDASAVARAVEHAGYGVEVE